MDPRNQQRLITVQIVYSKSKIVAQMTVAKERLCRVFLDLHFEEKIKDLFRDSEFLTLLKRGKEQIKRAVSSSGIHDIFHGMDY